MQFYQIIVFYSTGNSPITTTEANSVLTTTDVNSVLTTTEVQPVLTTAEVQPAVNTMEVNSAVTATEVNSAVTATEVNSAVTATETNPVISTSTTDSTDPLCISSCCEQADGRYVLCENCTSFVSCSNGNVHARECGSEYDAAQYCGEWLHFLTPQLL